MTPMSPAEKLAALKRPAPTRPKVWECRLREVRQALGLSQREVALAVGLSPAGYHQVESGQFDVCLTTCYKLAEFFGLSVQDIWVKPLP